MRYVNEGQCSLEGNNGDSFKVHLFERIAIVDSGQAALRLIRAVQELNREQHLRLSTVALFTEPDRQALFVREADDAVCIGPAAFVDQSDGQWKSGYLDRQRIEQALLAAHVDAAWTGWGLLAGKAWFADLCKHLGIVIVGSNAQILRLLGNKISARQLAQQCKIPVVPCSDSSVETEEEARQYAERLGYPLVVKPTTGRRGVGIHYISSPSELAGAFKIAREEAHWSYDDASVFLEHMIDGVHQIEVQIIADSYGTVWAVGVCDSTVQHRNQKMLEESGPSMPLLGRERELRQAAIHLCQRAGYQGIGSVEFLYDPIQQTFWFLEVNPYLSAAHPLIEVTTGLDLVKLQLEVACGGRLEGEPPIPIGHALEVPMYVKDLHSNLMTNAGKIELLRLAGGPGLRVDTSYGEGDFIHPQFDPLLATITALGRNRQEALARLSRALAESAVLVHEGVSNKALLLDLLQRPELETNNIDTLWLDRLIPGEPYQSRQHADVALLQAAVEAYNVEHRLEQAEFRTSAARGRYKVRQSTALPVDFRYLGQGYRFQVSRLGPQQYRLIANGQSIDLYVEQLGSFERRISCFGQRYRVLTIVDEPDYYIEVEGRPHFVTHEEEGIVRAPAPAIVVSITVAPGAYVEIGDRLAVVEAMKMEMAIVAPQAGRVAQVFVTGNVQVEEGAPLVQIKSSAWDDKASDSERVQFGNAIQPVDLDEEDSQARCRRVFEALRCQMLGYDFDALESRRLLAEQNAVYHLIAPDDPALLQAENEILAIFADICLLFRRERDPVEAGVQEEQVHSAEYDLLSYLRSPDTRKGQLSMAFRDNLQRALAHYGIRDLDPSPEIDESLLLIYKSHQHVNQQVAVVLAILGRRLEHADNPALLATGEMPRLLDRLLLASQGRYPAIHDLTREVRFHCFEEPLFERVRATVYEEMKAHLAYLAASPYAPDRDERMRALVACPQPLHNLLMRRFSGADDNARRLMLEVLTRRYYRLRRLEDCECTIVDGHMFAKAAFDYEGARNVVVTTFTTYTALATAATTAARFVNQIPEEYEVVIDFYAWQSDPLRDAETTQKEIHTILNATDFPSRLRRIVVVIGAPGKGLSMASTQHFTYQHAENGYQEERLYRGLHPMMGERLHIWRLANFEIERLPSVEDVYLFHGIARNNPKDERLFALAEVRDMTPLRDEAGTIIQLPQLERMLMEALEGIRLYQSHLPVHQRLPWNRVLLYVWPPLHLQPENFLQIMRKLWPATEGLGLERIVVAAKIAETGTGELRERMLHFSRSGGRELVLRESGPIETPIATLSKYRQKVVQLRQRGLVYPYELLEMLTPESVGIHTQIPPGDFTEYDLNEDYQLVPVDRPYGNNSAGIVVGVIRNYTPKYPEGMARVILLGDPAHSLGSVAEPECRRINEAINLAERLQVPLEWFTLSAGAKISMESGTENMDWVARALRRIVEFTQAGGEINVIVNGINVGAQPYWNAGATMLMHTRGVLIMTPDGAMVLTGKQSLDYSGGVSAEDNYGIGGYERIMGPNGQAQYFAPDLSSACQLLMRHYDHTYVMPGERFPRRAHTSDAATRDVCSFPYFSTRPEDSDLTCIGDLFSDEKNAGRKRAFDIRTLMAALIDADQKPLERWHDMRDADTVVVWDAHIGGYPVAMLGIESRPIARYGFVPGDGPEQWTAGTLFPMSSKKAARAINATSGNRPLVVIANLSGFDGSPESLRSLELEYGAEIGRAIANFKGPIIFCVVSRYHGGTFVVFSKALNEHLEAVAVEGSYASIIGGVPAAAVVFAREVDTRTKNDSRVKDMYAQLAQADGSQKASLQVKLNEVTAIVRAEKVGEVASEFDHTHNVQRALRVGSIDRVIPAAQLRLYLVEALERKSQL